MTLKNYSKKERKRRKRRKKKEKEKKRRSDSRWIYCINATLEEAIYEFIYVKLILGCI